MCRLEDYVSSVQPTFTKLKGKYEASVRQATMRTIEKEKVTAEVSC